MKNIKLMEVLHIFPMIFKVKPISTVFIRIGAQPRISVHLE